MIFVPEIMKHHGISVAKPDPFFGGLNPNLDPILGFY